MRPLAKKLNTTAEKVPEWESEGTLTYKRTEKIMLRAVLTSSK
jgi:hypothetical protein